MAAADPRMGSPGVGGPKPIRPARTARARGGNRETPECEVTKYCKILLITVQLIFLILTFSPTEAERYR